MDNTTLRTLLTQIEAEAAQALAQIVSQQVTVTTAATKLTAAQGNGLRGVVIINNGSSSVFVGPSTVTTSTGAGTR